MSLDARNITAGYYRDIHILQDVSVCAGEGEITLVIGANGVGKSTLLKTICGFLKPVAGNVFYNNEDITCIDPYAISEKGISYIPQRRNVFPYLTVEENWELGAWRFRRERKRMKQRMGENFERFGELEAKRRTHAGALSGGEQRMVEIGRALMVDPGLLMVDEPTAGLAPKVAEKIYARLRQLNVEEGKTILLVDQNIRQAIKIADYIYVLELGGNQARGTRAEFETSLDERVREWLSF